MGCSTYLGLGWRTTSPLAPGHPTSICDIGVNHRQTNIEKGERGGEGAVLLMYHCSGRICRSTKCFIAVLSTIVVASL